MEPVRSAISDKSAEEAVALFRETKSGVVRVGFFTKPGPTSVGYVCTTIKATAPVEREDDWDLIQQLLGVHIDAVKADSKRSGQPALMCVMTDAKETSTDAVAHGLSYGVWGNPHEYKEHPEWLESVLERITAGRKDVALWAIYCGVHKSRHAPAADRVAVIRQTLAEHMKKSDLASDSSQVLLLSVEDESGTW